jgi:hypothetical protein
MASMDNLITKYITHLSMDLLIFLVSILGTFFLSTSGFALTPLKVVQLVTSNQQSILMNITTTEISLLSQSIIKNIYFLKYTESIISILSLFFFLLDLICYLKAELPKHRSNY